MANKIENYLILFGEELGKEAYSILKAGVNTFYKTKGEVAAYTIDNYMNTRFEIRLGDFAYEQERLSREQREKFYQNIDAKQLNFLFELLEKARTSTYDLHAKILSRLYGNLILNGNLNYHESTFLANINIMNDEDLYKFYNLLDVFFKEQGIDIETAVMKQEKIEYHINSYTDFFIFEKLQRVGLIVDKSGIDGVGQNRIGDIRTISIIDFSKDMYLLMKEIEGVSDR